MSVAAMLVVHRLLSNLIDDFGELGAAPHDMLLFTIVDIIRGAPRCVGRNVGLPKGVGELIRMVVLKRPVCMIFFNWPANSTLSSRPKFL